jgi:hypothetical protein
MFKPEILLGIASYLSCAEVFSRYESIQSKKFQQEHIEKANNDVYPLLTFTDKKTYLEWVRNWQFEYFMVSRRIREAKKAVREMGCVTDWRVDYPKVRTLWMFRQHAAALLYIRAASKFLSNQQRENRLKTEIK